MDFIDSPEPDERSMQDTGLTQRRHAAKFARIVVSAVACLCLQGCGLGQWKNNGFKVGQDYCRPNAAVADLWIETDDQRIDDSRIADVEWWNNLDDPQLNRLIRTAYDQNLSLRQAGWRVMQARAIESIAVGNLFPQSQQITGEFDRNLLSETVAGAAGLRAFNEWSTGLTLAWELDVWGRYRRSVIAAEADVQISVADYDAILLCLIADVAQAYVQFRTAEQRLEYALNNIKIQQSSLELTEKKAKEGETGFTGVYLARASLESTRATVPDIRIELRQASNQLCVLLGLPPQNIDDLLGKGPIPKVPSQVATGVPANLLRRRPDIRAAERSVASQSEQIGIALADLYPSFTLTGNIALESEKLGDLFSSASGAGFVGPGFQWNVLNYGRLINNVQLQEYGLRELVESYRNTVLVANREVEDAMVEFLRTEERVRDLEKSVTATEEALRLLTISFEEGEIDFGTVFVLQGSLVTSQDRLAQARGDVVSSLIDLYKALGGGWEARCHGFSSETISDQNLPGEDIPVPNGFPLEPHYQNKGEGIPDMKLPEPAVMPVPLSPQQPGIDGDITIRDLLTPADSQAPIH